MKLKFFFVLVTVLVVSTMSCSRKNSRQISDPQEFSQYIASHTSGTISISETVKLMLNFQPSENTMVPENIFQFEPSIKGKTVWNDSGLLEFRPEKPFLSGQTYLVTVDLGKIIKVPEGKRYYTFQFRTIDVDYSLEVDAVKSFLVGNELKVSVNGTVLTSDIFENTLIEKMVHAYQNGKELPVGWTHQEKLKQHQFEIDDIKRGKEAGKVKLVWNGKSIGADSGGDREIEIPELGRFYLLSAKGISGGSPYIELLFSDPLDVNQETSGIFRMDDVNFEVSIVDNLVKLFPDKPFTGEKKLEIYEGLKNYSGARLGKTELSTISLESEKPAIRFIGKGNIVPSSDGLVLPFEAVNLSAVDIRILKIFENNFHQFFQMNDLDGDNSLKNVGRPVYYGSYLLSRIHSSELNKWSAYSIRLDDLITIEPGAIYQVQLIMQPEYSLYPCPDDAQVKTIKRKKTSNNEEDWLKDSYYYEGGGWSEYEGDFYDWQNRKDPCYIAYFIDNRSVSKNVIASNLGLLAKRGSDGKMLVVATNLLNARPESDVELKIYDFQQQLIVSAQTDGNGMSETVLDRTPFMLVAKKGKDVGYLKISDGASLQLSRFDVGGDEVQKGLKGFLYGERGVWRPGDSLYVSLILANKVGELPANHPVVFELYNPSEQLVSKGVIPLSGNITTFRTSTNEDAATGSWRLIAKVGGAEFSKRLRIETVKPNRLKLQFQTNPEELRGDAKNQNAKLTAKWLHGSPANDMNAKVEMSLKKVKTVFSRFLNYTFDNQASQFESAEQTIYEGKLNEAGEVNFPVILGKLDNAPGKLEAVFTTRIFEPGGDYSISQFNKKVSPFSKYVGMRFPDEDVSRKMLSTGKDTQLDLVVVDADGNPEESQIEISIYKINWRWWWDASDDYLGNYVSQEHYKPFLTKKIAVSGKASMSFRIENENWGRYLVMAKLPSGHSVSQVVYIDWPYGSSAGQDGGAAMLSFSADKEKYSAGDDITVTVPSSAGGKALVSVENGSSVLNKFWVDTEAGQTKLKIKATPEMAPNFYLFITVLQPHGQTINDKPIRMYGVIPVSVEDPETHLQPVIKAPEELRSQKTFSVDVSEAKGREMSYTLAVVDEGLLDLTGFKTPDPWYSFYAREALGVKTWDLYDYVLGAYGGKLEKLFAVGGSDQLLDPSKQKAQRFKPVVKFLGPFLLKKNQKRVHQLILPQYTGSVRMMVVAASNRAYANTEKTVPVRDPLMVLATVPRVIGINETFELPVNVFAQTSAVQNVKVSVEVNSLLKTDGATNQSVSFATPGEKDIRFRLKSTQTTGKATIKVVAESGNERAVYEVEVQVRNPNPRIVVSQTKMVDAGKSWETDISSMSTEEKGSATIEVSSVPPLNLAQRVDYLINYPHGCIEQTVSAIFPQLFLSRFVSLSPDKLKEIESNVKQGIENLRKFQLPDGSFSYWPGNSYTSLWGTSYAGNFIIEAENAGYAIPGDVKKKWLNYQKGAANRWQKDYTQGNVPLDQAYRLYTLALAGSPAIGAMNRLRESADLPLAASWQLASAYVLAGRVEVAELLVDMTKLTPQNYEDAGPTFGSSLRDRAMLLETLTLLKKKEASYPIAKAISDELCSQHWMSTQTSSFCLIAMSKFVAQTTNKASERSKFKLTINGKSEDVIIDKSVFSREIFQPGNKLSVKVDNISKSDLYISVVQAGVPVSVDIPAKQSGLVLDVAYLSAEGKPLDVKKLQKGIDFTAVVRVKNTGYSEVLNLALTQVFPSGWEIFNERLFGGVNGSNYSYRDIRDDRVLTYFDLKVNEQKEFRVKLNAAYSGIYYLSPVSCEAMYNNLISGNTTGFKVEVEK